MVLELLPKPDLLATVNDKDRNGNTVLHHAARGHTESFRVILELYPESEHLVALNEKNLDGNTVLHCAVRGHPESFRVILERYPESDRLAAVIKKNRLKDNILHEAIRFSESPQVILQVILESLPISHLPTLLRENEGVFSGDRFIQLKSVVVNKLMDSTGVEQMTAIHDAKNSPELQRALDVVLQAKMKETVSGLREGLDDKNIGPTILP